MNLADSMFHFGFRWEAFPPFAHRLEKNAMSSKSLLHIRHLLPSQTKRTPVSSPGIEPGPRPSQGRMRIRHTPRTFLSKTSPRN